VTPSFVRRLRAVATWPLSQRLLRVVVALGLVLAVLALSLGFAAAPDTGAGTLAMLVVLVWWIRVPGDALHGSVLLAAAALLVTHVAALLVATAPPQTPVDPRVARLWLLRGAGVLAAAPVLWVLALALRDGTAPDGLWFAGLVVVLLAATAAAAAFPPAPSGLPAPRGR
jgi:hypothetical protein